MCLSLSLCLYVSRLPLSLSLCLFLCLSVSLPHSVSFSSISFFLAPSPFSSVALYVLLCMSVFPPSFALPMSVYLCQAQWVRLSLTPSLPLFLSSYLSPSPIVSFVLCLSVSSSIFLSASECNVCLSPVLRTDQLEAFFDWKIAFQQTYD